MGKHLAEQKKRAVELLEEALVARSTHTSLAADWNERARQALGYDPVDETQEEVRSQPTSETQKRSALDLAVAWFGEAIAESQRQLEAWSQAERQAKIHGEVYAEARQEEDKAREAFYRALRAAHNIPEPTKEES